MKLKELVGYLPYGLGMMYDFENGTEWTLDVTNINAITGHDKPILRPMSDLTNHECYILLSEKLRMCVEVLSFPNVNDLKVNDYNILLKNHFDIYHLIEKEEAIDVNKIL